VNSSCKDVELVGGLASDLPVGEGESDDAGRGSDGSTGVGLGLLSHLGSSDDLVLICSRDNVLKLFLIVINKKSSKLECFVPCRPFQPGLILAVMTEALPRPLTYPRISSQYLAKL
jgi:hypothetical protein